MDFTELDNKLLKFKELSGEERDSIVKYLNTLSSDELSNIISNISTLGASNLLVLINPTKKEYNKIQENVVKKTVNEYNTSKLRCLDKYVLASMSNFTEIHLHYKHFLANVGYMFTLLREQHEENNFGGSLTNKKITNNDRYEIIYKFLEKCYGYDPEKHIQFVFDSKKNLADLINTQDNNTKGNLNVSKNISLPTPEDFNISYNSFSKFQQYYKSNSTILSDMINYYGDSEAFSFTKFGLLIVGVYDSVEEAKRYLEENSKNLGYLEYSIFKNSNRYTLFAKDSNVTFYDSEEKFNNAANMFINKYEQDHKLISEMTKKGAQYKKKQEIKETGMDEKYVDQFKEYISSGQTVKIQPAFNEDEQKKLREEMDNELLKKLESNRDKINGEASKDLTQSSLNIF